MKAESVPVTHEAAVNAVYPGYPARRLTIHDLADDGDLTLPDGEWSTGVHVYPSSEQQEEFLRQGYELDSFGRPLHPWLRDMLADEHVGVVTGLGEYWRWGPNRTADPIVMTTDPVPKILLIRRSDTGTWALPGGFVDDDEQPIDAAKRELFEEAGLIITGTGHVVYDGPVADVRTTAHAWPETTAAAWNVEGTPSVNPNDDAADAGWFAIDDLPASLHGSHGVLIQTALDAAIDGCVAHAISAPARAESYQPVGGGHMLYHRFVVSTSTGPDMFVKSHDKQAFSDPIREAHSKQYLHKEKRLYDHVRQHGFRAVPDSVSMQHDHSLMIEALLEKDGWQWRAPKDRVADYIDDTLAALDTLQSIATPDDFHDTQLPTVPTFAGEGWQSIDDVTMSAIRTKLKDWMPRMRPEFREVADRFMSDIELLGKQFDALQDPSDTYLCHHDLRQANIAWHPDHGTKIVDWSWAGIGRKDSDATTLLIDLHKSGHDVSGYMDRFNADHALTLIGFWVVHSLWPVRDNDTTVRFHQAVSALSAYDLLMKYRQR